MANSGRAPPSERYMISAEGSSAVGRQKATQRRPGICGKKGSAMSTWEKCVRGAVLTIKFMVLYLTFVFMTMFIMSAICSFSPSSSDNNDSMQSNITGVGNGNVSMESIADLADEVGSPRLPAHLLRVLNEIDGICSSANCMETADTFLHSINFSSEPCTNFYDFACGQKLEQMATFPNQILEKSQNMHEILAEILKKPLNGPEDSMAVAKAKVFYQQCVNTTKLDTIGLAPFQERLSKHGGWPILDRFESSGENSWDEEKFNWLEMVAYLRREFGVSALMDVQVRPDMKSVERKLVIMIDQPSLVIPREKLTPRDKHIVPIYKKYLKNVAQVFMDSDPSPPHRHYPKGFSRGVQQILDFEIQLAELSTSDEDRDEKEDFTRFRMYNMRSVDSYQNETAKFENGELEELNWKQFLNSVFQSTGITLTGTEELIVREPEYFMKLIRFLRNTPKRVLANYLGFRLVHAMADDTTQQLRDYRETFYEQVIGLGDISEPRETTCTRLAMKHFEVALLTKLFDKEDVVKVEEIFVNIRTVLHDLLTPGVDNWVSPPTALLIQNQLAATKLVIGSDGPTALTEEIVEDFYTSLEIDLESGHFSNVMHLAQWESDGNLKKIGTPLGKELSIKSLVTDITGVSPRYITQFNAIVLPGGILQEPFFHKGAPEYLNYAGIGQSIGHELAHGFLNSKLRRENWWTNDSSAQFKAKAQCFQKQYDAYEPLPGLHMNGQLTLNENMADNLGLLLTFKAYEKAKAMEQEKTPSGIDARLPGLEQFCQDQLFFLAFANSWCEKQEAAELEKKLGTSLHSPSKYRVLGSLENSKEFANAFQCPVGWSMNPEKKCTFW